MYLPPTPLNHPTTIWITIHHALSLVVIFCLCMALPSGFTHTHSHTHTRTHTRARAHTHTHRHTRISQMISFKNYTTFKRSLGILPIDMIVLYLCKLSSSPSPSPLSLYVSIFLHRSFLFSPLNHIGSVIISIKQKHFLNIQVALETSVFLVKCLVRLMLMPPLVPPLHSLKNSSGFSNWAIQAEAGATALEGKSSRAGLARYHRTVHN